MKRDAKRFAFVTSPVVPNRTPIAQAAPAAIVPRISPSPVAFRLVQRMPDKARGLVIGYGLPEDFPLPGWGLVLSGDAPGLVDIPAARRLAGVSAEVPLLLVGSGPGVKTVFQTFISNHTRDVAGVAFFDAEYPTDAYSLSLWIHLAERSAAGKGLRLLTDLRAPDRALAAVLGAAQAPAGGNEPPTARLARLMAEAFGPTSKPLPDPLPPTEHFTPEG